MVLLVHCREHGGKRRQGLLPQLCFPESGSGGPPRRRAKGAALWWDSAFLTPRPSQAGKLEDMTSRLESHPTARPASVGRPLRTCQPK